MTADQQAAFLNESGFNSLTTAQQSALLNTLNTSTSQWIAGVPNNVVLIGGAVLLLMLFLGSRK